MTGTVTETETVTSTVWAAVGAATPSDLEDDAIDFTDALLAAHPRQPWAPLLTVATQEGLPRVVGQPVIDLRGDNGSDAAQVDFELCEVAQTLPGVVGAIPHVPSGGSPR